MGSTRSMSSVRALKHLCGAFILLVTTLAMTTTALAQDTSGKVSITSEPTGAGVIVNNRRMGVTPLELTLPGGTMVTVAIELEGFAPFEETVTPEAGKTTEVKATLAPVDGASPPDAPKK